MDVEKLWKNKEYFAKGKRGYIYKSGKYVIKTKNPDSHKDPVEFEAKYNKILNKIKIGPKFHYYDKKRNFMIREFVDGENLFDWIEQNKNKNSFRKNLQKIILDLLEQCRRMDVAKINKMEMNHPHKDIIVDEKNKPYIIDFERCKETLKPKNVTQFMMFLSQGKMHYLLKEQKINFTLKKAMSLTSKYKKDMNEKKFREIKNYVKETLI